MLARFAGPSVGWLEGGRGTGEMLLEQPSLLWKIKQAPQNESLEG